MIELYECGTKAVTSTGNIECVITCASVRFGKVSYELSYFHNGEYKSAWLNEAEFSVEVNKFKTAVGYKK